MAVTLTTHSVTAPYTATDFATKIRLAFIDAGWMTDWYASFADGTRQHRVMKIDHDNTKTYGTTYYWFVFDGADMFFHITRTWDTGTNVPTGTQYLDFLSTSKTVTTNHMRFATQNANTSVQIRVYRSQANTDFSVILVKNGTVEYQLILDQKAPTSTIVDLTKVCYQGLMWCRTRAQANTACVNFQAYSPKLRGSHLGAPWRAATAVSQFGAGTTGAPWEHSSGDFAVLPGTLYQYPGNASNDGNNANFFGNGGTLLMPVGFNNVNGGYSSNYNPPFYDFTLNNYSPLKLPSDFVILASYASITLSTFDSVVVQAGTEIYEIITVANGSVIGDRPSVMFAARTT